MSSAASGALEQPVVSPLTLQRCQFRIAPPQKRAVCRSQQVPRILFVLVAQDEKCIKPSDFSDRDKDFRANEENRQKKKKQRLESNNNNSSDAAGSNGTKANVPNFPGDGGNRIWRKLLVYDDTTLREVVETVLFDEYCVQLLMTQQQTATTAADAPPSAAAAAPSSTTTKENNRQRKFGNNTSPSSPAIFAEIFHVYPGEDKRPSRDSLGKINLSVPVFDAKVDLVTIAELADPKSKEFRGGDMLCVCGTTVAAPAAAKA